MFFAKFPIENVSDNKQQQLLQQHQHQMQKMQQDDQKEAERARSETNVSRENSEERMNMMSPLMSKLCFIKFQLLYLSRVSNNQFFLQIRWAELQLDPSKCFHSATE